MMVKFVDYMLRARGFSDTRRLPRGWIVVGCVIVAWLLLALFALGVARFVL